MEKIGGHSGKDTKCDAPIRRSFTSMAWSKRKACYLLMLLLDGKDQPSQALSVGLDSLLISSMTNPISTFVDPDIRGVKPCLS